MKKGILFLVLLFSLAASLEDARKANEAYENGNYTEAVALYKKAIQAEPENAKLYFNLGNALAKSGAPEEAIRYYEQYKQMTDRPNEKAMADYNVGNIYSEQKKWDQAVTSYKKAMRHEATDVDAKHNYELALKQQQSQDQQNKDQQNDQQNKDQEQEKDQENSQNQQDNQQNQNQDQNQDQNQQQQNQNQDQDQQQQNEQGQQQQQQNENQQKEDGQKQQQPTKISRADAENILKALEQQEKELLKDFKKKNTESSNTNHEKDW